MLFKTMFAHKTEIIDLFYNFIFLLHYFVLIFLDFLLCNFYQFIFSFSELCHNLHIFLDNLFKCLHTPCMTFEPQHFLEARVFIQEHTIECSRCITVIFLVNIVLSVRVVRFLFKCEALNASIFSIENNTFVDWLGRQNIFHPSYDFKSVFI